MAAPQPAGWQRFRRHAPSVCLSVLLHVAILGPLCMVTWAIGQAIHTDAILSMGPTAEAAAEDPAAGPVDEEPLPPGEQSAIGPAGESLSGVDRPAANLRGNPLLPPSPSPKGLTGLGKEGPGPGSGTPGDSSTYNPGGTGGDGLTDALLDASGGRGGTGGNTGGAGNGGILEGASVGFGKEIGALRGSGLDLVLVLDATDSMRPYILQAKQRLQQVLDVVLGLVPSSRIGIVAYKDYGDDYGPTAVKFLKLSRDTNAVRNFLNDIVAGGGGDEPEPIHEALRVATNPKVMGWANGRKWVIILAGDSSIHTSGREEAFRLAKQFATARGTISVIDVAIGSDEQRRRVQVKPDLGRIAQEGNGSAFLLREEKDFWRYLIVSVFGERFQDDVDMIIRKFVAQKPEGTP